MPLEDNAFLLSVSAVTELLWETGASMLYFPPVGVAAGLQAPEAQCLLVGLRLSSLHSVTPLRVETREQACPKRKSASGLLLPLL